MTGAELNKLRTKAENILDKANELIRFINMNEITSLVIKKHSFLVGFSHTQRMMHSINRRNVIVDYLKSELKCIG